MIKLTTKKASQQATVVQLEGRLNAEAVEQLHTLLASGVAGSESVLDISGVTSIDTAGRACLVDLRRSGARLIGGSLYINQLLEEARS